MSDLTFSHLAGLRANLEALLFVAPGPVAPSQFAEALDLRVDVVEQELTAMAEDYAARRGLSLQWFAGKVQLTSAPEAGVLVEKFLGLEATARLSRAALETLAIVAYRQPITRPGVDAIRGVNSDGVMKSLLNKGMFQEMGRAETPGRPILYGITNEFLEHFGLATLADLPAYDEPVEGEIINDEASLLKD
jgi:segregation and condensation protein B